MRPGVVAFNFPGTNGFCGLWPLPGLGSILATNEHEYSQIEARKWLQNYLSDRE
jgi:hypothetical protein